MTTTALPTDSSDLAELREAMRNARIAHKKAILRADVPGVVAAAQYEARLQYEHDRLLDSLTYSEAPILDDSFEYIDAADSVISQESFRVAQYKTA